MIYFILAGLFLFGSLIAILTLSYGGKRKGY
jgi:hypothetical protein